MKNNRRSARRALCGAGCGPARGFTLIEILVVISLFVLLLAIGVPAFANLLRSSERSLANNAMTNAIRAARDIAQRGEGGDGALVFSMEPGGRLTMVPCIQVGTLLDRTSDSYGPAQNVRRDVFVPHPLFKSSQLPSGWTVRGFASAGTIDGEWYGDKRTANAYELVGTETTNTQPQWVMPETGYYRGNQYAVNKVDPDSVADNGRNRQTFMLRFASGSGELTASPTGAIVVLPIPGETSPTPAQQSLTTTTGKQFARARYAPDLRVWATQVLNDSALDLDTLDTRLKLIGDESIDTVLAKTVPWVTMSGERQLAADLGRGKIASGPYSGQTISISPDRLTGTLYKSGEAPVLAGGDPVKLSRIVNALINGQMIALTKDSEDKFPSVVPEAQVFLVSAYQGNTLEVRQ